MSTAQGRAAYAYFVASLPHLPQATNDFRRFGLYKHSREEALASRYIQPDRKYQAAWAKFDVDKVEACAFWIDQGLPPPHLLMGNPRNGHGHLMYGLKVPVVTSIGGRLAPLKFMASVESGFTRLLTADPAYSGHTVKTPYHPSWFTHEHDGPLYELRDLIDALPVSISTRPIPRVEYVGVSRTLDLFDALRYWAYGEARAAKMAGDYSRWEQAIYHRAHDLNLFDNPLAASDVRSVARSVAAWTWRNAERLNGSVLGGVKRSRLKSGDRERLTEEVAQQGRGEGQEHTSRVRRSKTFDAISAGIAALAGQGIHHPSAAQISRASGVSVRSVMNWRAGQRQGQGMN